MFKNKGFTLIELMVVIVIIGVLAALAIPRFVDASAKAKMAEPPTVLKAYESAQFAYIAERGALGGNGELAFTAPTDSKWFGYDYKPDNNPAPAKAGYQATAQSTIGSFASGGFVGTKFENATVANSRHYTSSPATAYKYVPNWITGTAGVDVAF